MNTDAIKAVHKWFEGDPHLNDLGELVDRSSLLRVCLGLGILLDDACLALFAEGDYGEDVPRYITLSAWDLSDHDRFVEYMQKLQIALWNNSQEPRCVNEWVGRTY